MGGKALVPTLSLDAGLTNYLVEIRKFPILRQDQESAYAKRWRDHRDWTAKKYAPRRLRPTRADTGET
jgi:DNA-directed RNA polymerase sigma subunit (sigma70/sigma32)